MANAAHCASQSMGGVGVTHLPGFPKSWRSWDKTTRITQKQASHHSEDGRCGLTSFRHEFRYPVVSVRRRFCNVDFNVTTRLIQHRLGSKLRHKYQVATVRHGAKRWPKARRAFGVGCRRPGNGG